MTVSGTTSWQLTTGKIINGALRLLGAIQTGEIPPDDEYQDALDALNGMVKSWQASGIHLWTETDCTLFLQPNQIQYQLGTGSADHATTTAGWVQTTTTATAASGATSITVDSATGIVSGNQLGLWLDDATLWWSTVVSAPSGKVVALSTALPSQAAKGARVVSYASALVRPLRVPAARRYQFAAPDGQPIEIPLIPLSRLDYAAVPNKQTSGTVTEFFYDPQLGFGLMNVWPAPSDTTNSGAIKFTAQQPLDDFTTQADTADLPVEWTAALRFGLAKELALEYDCPAQRAQFIAAMAAEKFAMVSAWDREPQSVLFGLSFQASGRSG